MKKLLSIILIFAIVLTFFPNVFVAAESIITDVNKAVGSNYTDNTKLKAAFNAIFKGDIDIHSDSSCKNEVSMPVGYRMNVNNYYYVKSKKSGNNCIGMQCYIYANAVYNKLFGEWVRHGDILSHSEVVLSGGDSKVSYSKFSSAGVKSGAYMRTTVNSNGAYNGNYGHSLIILSYDKNNISYLEGNADNNGLVRITKQTWDEFNKTELSGRSTPRYVSHIVQPVKSKYQELYPVCSHTYSNGYDAVCNGCGEKRSIPKELYQFTTIDENKALSYSAYYDMTVSIFGKNGCQSTASILNSIIESGIDKQKNIRFLFIDCENKTKTQVKEMAKKYKNSNIVFCYDTTQYSVNAMWSLAYMAGFKDGITLPLTVFTKKDGTIFKITQGDIEADYLNQLSNGDLSGEKIVELSVGGEENYDYAYQVLNKLNDLRKKSNLKPLTMDKNLLSAAMRRAAEISINYSHIRPNGEKFNTVLENSGIDAENITIAQTSPDSVMNHFKKYIEKYNNMVNADYLSVGIGCFKMSNGRLCWVQLFSRGAAKKVEKSGKITATHKIIAQTRKLVLEFSAEKDIHSLSASETSKINIWNHNKYLSPFKQLVNNSDFNFKSSDGKILSVDKKGNCTMIKNGECSVTVSHKQNAALKLKKDYLVGHRYEDKALYKCSICGYIETKPSLRKIGDVYYYYNNGVPSKDNTLVKHTNNKWYHVKNGVKSNYTGLFKYNKVWYYIKNGEKNSDDTLVKYTDGKWYHVKNGKIIRDTTLVKYNNKWYHIRNGVKSNYTGLFKYNKAWYYIKNGVKNNDDTLVKYTDGKWYHVKNGKLAKDTTIVKYGTKRYYVKNGVKSNLSGYVKVSGKTYKIKNGVVI